MNHQKITTVIIKPVKNLSFAKFSKILDHDIFKPVLGFFSLICIILISFGVYIQTHQNKIYPGIKVAGIQIGGKTISEAEKTLDQYTAKWETQKVKVEFGQTSTKSNLKEIGIEYSSQQLVQKAFAIGHNPDAVASYKEVVSLLYQNYQIGLEPQFKSKKWQKFLEKYTAKIEQKAGEPSIQYLNGKIKIVLGQPGVTIDTKKLKKQIFENTKTGPPKKISIPLNSSQIKVPDERTQELISQAESMANPVTLTFEGMNFSATKAQIVSWLILQRTGDEFSLEINSGSVSGFVATIASRVDISTQSKEVTPSGRVLKEGADGRALNRSQAVAQVLASLRGGSRQIALATSPVKRPVKTIYPAGTPGLYDGKYIEIVLSKQTLYAFEGKEMVSSFAISSGLPGTSTPTGNFSIYSKSRSVTMAGPGYYLPGVQWVNRFNNGFSIHGTYWHSNFGHPMSHGCVNATNGNAAFIYGWAPIGTPVYIH